MGSLENFSSELGAISSQPNSSRPAAYHQLILKALRSPASDLSEHELIQAISLYLQQAVFSEQNSTGGGLVVGRQALTSFSDEIKQVSHQKASVAGADDMQDGSIPAIHDPEVRRKVLEEALERLQPRVLSFEEQASTLRSQLSKLLEAEEDWIQAATVLQAIPLESGHRTVSDHYKLSIYMRIVRLLLEGDDPVGADVFLKRASLVIHNVPGAMLGSNQSVIAGSSEVSDDHEDPKVLGLQFKLCQARIYDAQRRFAEAAVRYHELSYVTEIDEGDRNMMLSAAVTASILSPAGPQRARTLATLIKDERTQSLPQYTILSKVFLDHIIRPHEIQAFEKLLAPHQVAKLAPGRQPTSASDTDSRAQSTTSSSRPVSTRHAPSTVLDRAMIEHNLLSASRLYDNITLNGLGELLDLSPQGAEETARRMIQQGRLKAWIDQVGEVEGDSGVLYFIDQDRRAESGTIAGGLSGATSIGPDGQNAEAAEAISGEALGISGSADPDAKWTRRWDQQIARTAGALEQVCQRLIKAEQAA